MCEEAVPVNGKTLTIHDDSLPVYDAAKLVQTVGQCERWLKVYDDVLVVGLFAAQTGSVTYAQ